MFTILVQYKKKKIRMSPLTNIASMFVKKGQKCAAVKAAFKKVNRHFLPRFMIFRLKN